MCWLAPRPASGTGRTSNLAFGNFCRYFHLGACATRYLAKDSCYDRQSWALLGCRVNPASTCLAAWTYESWITHLSFQRVVGYVFVPFHLVAWRSAISTSLAVYWNSHSWTWHFLEMAGTTVFDTLSRLNRCSLTVCSCFTGLLAVYSNYGLSPSTVSAALGCCTLR